MNRTRRLASAGVPGLRRTADTDERVVASRALAFLFGCGGVLALITVSGPHPAAWDNMGVVAVALAAALTAALLLIAPEHMPYRLYFVAVLLSVLMIDAVILCSHEPSSPFAGFYTWSGLFAFYFLTGREAVAIASWASLNYGLSLWALGAVESDIPRWMMVTGSIIVIGAFIWFLRNRERRLMAQLADAAKRDHLTGALNRRGFDEAFELELERARRTGAPLALLVCDLDHFKQLNDEHGHPAGDSVLMQVARTLGAEKRRIDACARIGGEEFGLLLPGTDRDGAFIVADRLRCAIKKRLDAAGTPLTASIGICVYPGDGHTAATLLSAADQALYAAKQLGRDRVVVHKPDLTVSVLALTASGAATDESRLNTVLTLAEAVDLRDVGTAEHSRTVGRYARMIAEGLGLDSERVARIALAGVLHDVGKVAIPDSILRKPGPLTLEERLEMRRHSEIGAQMIEGAELYDIAGWVLAHHERPDGSGYPHGLRAHEIPLEAAILAVADSYEAMLSNRAYRDGIGAEAARAELEAGKGTQFDAEIVDVFLRETATRRDWSKLPVPSVS